MDGGGLAGRCQGHGVPLPPPLPAGRLSPTVDSTSPGTASSQPMMLLYSGLHSLSMLLMYAEIELWASHWIE